MKVALTGAVAGIGFQHFDTSVEVMGGKVGISHRHVQRLMTQPHLYAAQIDAAPDQPRRAGVPQDVRNDLLVVAKAIRSPPTTDVRCTDPKRPTLQG